MIEVEKKFILDKEAEAKLVDGAELLEVRTFTDIYFDTADYSLTTKDIWLRSRDGKFQLKLPLHQDGIDTSIDQYNELEHEDDIREALNLPQSQSLIETLTENGYRSFAAITTTRSKYKKDDLIIDMDSADYGYKIVEIETLVDAKDKIEEAARRILDFASRNGLTISPIRGKLIEYLRRNDPRHYQALVQADVVREE